MRKQRAPTAMREEHTGAPYSARGFSPGSAPDVDGDDTKLNEPETDLFPLLLRQVRELGEYFLYYFSAKADSVRLSLRGVLVNITLAALAFVIVGSLSVVAIWFMVNGAAEGLGVLLGNRPWAGNLLTGLLLAIGLAGGMWAIVIRHKNTTRERTVAKYENRQSRQQDRYGHTVADRAAARDPDANGPKPN